MRFSLLITSLLLLFACEKKSFHSDVLIVAHAATGLFNPKRLFHDNSMEAVTYALSFQELDAIELDVQFSADGTAWLYHDEDLSSQTNASGLIRTLSDDFLSTVHYNSLQNESVTPLSAISWEAFSNPKLLFWDIKLFGINSSDTLLLTNFVQILKNFPSQYSHAIIINNNSLAQHLRNFEFPLYADAFNVTNAKEILSLDWYDGIFLRNNVVAKEDIPNMQQNGKKVVIFDVRVPKSIREAAAKQPDFLMVEEFRTAISILKK
jgi:glycerophosphoryl diester phosphodiesterase